MFYLLKGEYKEVKSSYCCGDAMSLYTYIYIYVYANLAEVPLQQPNTPEEFSGGSSPT